MGMEDFASKLAALISKEARSANDDPEKLGEMVERLAAALGFTVAMASRGDGSAIDEMWTGVESYAHSEAVAKAPLARLLVVARS